MKFVVISDTHGLHDELIIPKGDVIIHAGDVSRIGRDSEIIDFLKWFKALDFKYRIFIAGNHDFFFERSSKRLVDGMIPDEVIYLNDSGVMIEGVKIWGSPISPWFHDWAFNRRRGENIRKHWDLIPSGTDILITHGPVYGIFDKTIHDEYVGCEDLLKKVRELRPKYHICGHIHEGYGMFNDGITTFINASVLDEKYRLMHSPVLFNL